MACSMKISTSSSSSLSPLLVMVILKAKSAKRLASGLGAMLSTRYVNIKPAEVEISSPPAGAGSVPSILLLSSGGTYCFTTVVRKFVNPDWDGKKYSSPHCQPIVACIGHPE